MLGQEDSLVSPVFARYSRCVTDRGEQASRGCVRKARQRFSFFRGPLAGEGDDGRGPSRPVDVIAAISIDFDPRATYKPVHPITISLGWRFLLPAGCFAFDIDWS